MTLTTHAVVGAAVCVHPWALPVALASHYAIDAIPHWDWDGRGLVGECDREFWIAWGKLLLDLGLGFALAFLMFGWLGVAGAFAGCLPDALQFLHRFTSYASGALERHQVFHDRIHTEESLPQNTGIGSQIVVCGFFLAVRLLVGW